MSTEVVIPNEELIINPAAYMWLLQGENMVGKSTVFAQIPDVRFIAVGANIKQLRVPQVWPTTWREVLKVTKDALADDSVSFIVYDTIDAIHQLQYVHTRKENPWKPGADHIGEISHGKGYDLAEDRFLEFLWSLKGCGKGVGLIANEIWVEKTYKGEPILQFLPDMDKRGKKIVSRAADIKARMFVDSMKDADGKVISKRYITCTSDSKYIGGDRTSRLGAYEKIELTSPEECWNDIVKAFQGDPS
jgi:hypothetical protein